MMIVLQLGFTIIAGYPEDLMLGQVAVFILGAIETSSSTLIYCLHELSHHSDIQVYTIET